MNKPELLMPAGSMDVLKTVITYGADAVYLGADILSLREKAKNFDADGLQEALRYAHERGKKVYLAVNIYAHNEDLPAAEAFFTELRTREEQPDAFICSDFGIISMARRICPAVPIHISTQTSCTNYETFLFWYGLGVRRVVCARELSLQEIREIRARIPADMEIECFVHGAMCMSYSGRCLISNFLASRDANHGACTHPCRWKYYLTEETRPGEYMPVEEDGRGTYLYNSKDLCMIEHLPELMEAGICSFKVEGRMKTQLYGATVARAYRLGIDAAAEDPARYREMLPWLQAEVRRCTTRSFCTGFYFGKPGADAQNYESSEYYKDYIYLGTVEEDEGGLFLYQKNKFSVREEIEMIRPDGSNSFLHITSFTTETGEKQESSPHPGQKLYITSDTGLKPGDILRLENAKAQFHR